MTNTARAALLAVALSVPALHTLTAQDTRTGRIVAMPGSMSLTWTAPADRAVLGVTLASAARGDTAGIRIESVDTDGPAAKAGLKAGDVITGINGVSLRVSAEDAEDLAMVGVTQRRLQRTLAKAKPGDQVDLQVRTGGASRSVKVQTVSAADLDKSRAERVTVSRRAGGGRGGDAGERATVGIGIGGSGSARDTLGLFVSSVVTGGPAEKAGIIEGERVAAVNGVDVRVAKEDVEDMSGASVRVSRFLREVQKVAPGGAVTLRVYGNGRYREVPLKTVKSSELPSNANYWQLFGGDGAVRWFRRDSGDAFELNTKAFESSMDAFHKRMENLGHDFQFQLKNFPMTFQDQGVHTLTLPRRGLIRM